MTLAAGFDHLKLTLIESLRLEKTSMIAKSNRSSPAHGAHPVASRLELTVSGG